MSTIIGPNDEIIAISEDFDTVKLSGLKEEDYKINDMAISVGYKSIIEPEKTLILGWNWRGYTIISELDHYVKKGSQVQIVANYSETEESLKALEDTLKHISLTWKLNEDINDRHLLDSLEVSHFDHIILLCYSDKYDSQEADSITLMTLLHLRDIGNNLGKNFSIVSEMIDIKNRVLAEVCHADDFIVGDKFVSLMLSQVSENKYLNAIFTDIFNFGGSEIYLRPAEEYVVLDTKINFYTVIAAAKKKGEVAMGYRIKDISDDSEKAYGVVVNPTKSEEITFTHHDKIIVIAPQEE